MTAVRTWKATCAICGPVTFRSSKVPTVCRAKIPAGEKFRYCGGAIEAVRDMSHWYAIR